ncbi:MAG: glutathione S-transferase family protein [Rhodobacteraceae bacterium]|nr:glutathione S-transferase family protein [Paracoccaceae bacterium]
MKLYDYVLSGNCYKIRLFAALLGIPYETVAVDLYPGKEQTRPAFLRLNPAGTLPVLQDGDLTLTDSSAILTYLARRHDPTGQWCPQDPELLAQLVGWLSFADDLTRTSGAARLHAIFKKPIDSVAAQKGAHALLRRLELHLCDQEFDDSSFLLGKAPTIADIACFPYVALAPDGGVELDGYAAVQRWIYAIRKLDGFLPMPGIHPLHEHPDKPLPEGLNARLEA